MSARVNSVFGALPTTIFTIMSALATEHGAINLGQGFPDEDGPGAIRDAAAKALIDGPNQYPPMRGMPALRAALSAHAHRFYGLRYDPGSEIVVTSGATEALTAAMMGLAGAGDEAILIEPAYDSYRPILEAMGATIKTVRLRPPDWKLTREALAAAFTPKTKLIVVNSPLNPVGRVFSRGELELLAEFLARFDAYAICDEVYEHLVFDRAEHVPLSTLPDMRERCLRVGSAGKMFSLTGWKIGWIMGPAPLMAAAANAHQFLTFTTSPALQLGIAHGIEKEMGFTLDLTRALQSKRDLLADGLERCGFKLLPCEGTYFLTADISGLTKEPDRAFCERITREAKVAAIPLSVFFAKDAPTHLVRFAFCKKREILEEAVARLQAFFAKAAA